MAGARARLVVTVTPVAGRVLSTLEEDGSRRWLRPRISHGRYLQARRVVGWVLIVLFAAVPHLTVGGRPLMRLDIPAREFTFFGVTFFPTESLLLALLLLTIFLSIFLLTALFGRVWCGWGCPQTIYMELLFRPIERFFDGRNYTTAGRAAANPLRVAGKFVSFFFVALFLAHTFLAYFVDPRRLWEFMGRSPLEHPSAFLIVAAVTALMMFDFCYMREQVCTLICPYGRFQSVLLDRQSLIVGYDVARGEPRGKRHRDLAPPEAELGDCIDCGACVVTCPTGIDIRDGLQMECIGCAQCIDACDQVMSRVGLPRGLVRYSSDDALATGRQHWLRPRIIAYPLLIAIVGGLFGFVLAGRTPAEITFLRNRNGTYRLLESGAVMNLVQIKVVNRTADAREFEIEAEGIEWSSADLPLAIAARESAVATLHVSLARDRFSEGRANVVFRVTDDAGFSGEYTYHVLGPLFAGDAGAAKAAP